MAALRYKHYSFDLWLTLIKSNPEFKPARAQWFADHFNPQQLPVEKVADVIRDIDVMCDKVNERTGSNIDALEMYAMVLHRLGYDMAKVAQRDLLAIYHVVDTIFEKHPPMFYDDDTEAVLNALTFSGATISILSNTGYIKGITLTRTLQKLGIGDDMLFTIFSDELGISKPNEKIYSFMINRVYSFRRMVPVSLKDIVHIGDNQLTDVDGPIEKAGIDAYRINSNDKTIKDILGL